MAESKNSERENAIREKIMDFKSRQTIAKETVGSKEIALIEGENLLTEAREILQELRQVDKDFDGVRSEEFLSVVFHDEIGEAESVAFLDYFESILSPNEKIFNEVSVMNLSPIADRVPCVYPSGSTPYNEHGVSIISMTNTSRTAREENQYAEKDKYEDRQMVTDHMDVYDARTTAMEMMRMQANINEATEKNIELYGDRDDIAPSVSAFVEIDEPGIKEFNETPYSESLKAGTFLYYDPDAWTLIIDHIPISYEKDVVSGESEILKNTLEKYIGTKQKWKGNRRTDCRQITLENIDKETFKEICIDLTREMPGISKEDRDLFVSRGRDREIWDHLSIESSFDMREVALNAMDVKGTYAVAYQKDYRDQEKQAEELLELKEAFVGSISFMSNSEFEDRFIDNAIGREKKPIIKVSKTKEEVEKGKPITSRVEIELTRLTDTPNSPLVSLNGDIKTNSEHVVQQKAILSDGSLRDFVERKQDGREEHLGFMDVIAAEILEPEKTLRETIGKMEERILFQQEIDAAWSRNPDLRLSDSEDRTSSVSTCVIRGEKLLTPHESYVKHDKYAEFIRNNYSRIVEPDIGGFFNHDGPSLSNKNSERSFSNLTHEIGKNMREYEKAEEHHISRLINDMKTSGTHLTYFPDQKMLIIDHRDIRGFNETRIMMREIEQSLNTHEKTPRKEGKDVHSTSDSRYVVIENVTQEKYQDIARRLVEKMPAITPEERDRVASTREMELNMREKFAERLREAVEIEYMRRLDPRIRTMADSPNFYPEIKDERYEKFSDMIMEGSVSDAARDYASKIIPTKNPEKYIWNAKKIKKEIAKDLEHCSSLGEGVSVNTQKIERIINMHPETSRDIDYLAVSTTEPYSKHIREEVLLGGIIYETADDMRDGTIEKAKETTIQELYSEYLKQEKAGREFDSIEKDDMRKLLEYDIAKTAIKQTNIRESKCHIVILPGEYNWGEHGQLEEKEKNRLMEMFSPAEEQMKDGKRIEIKTIDEIQKEGTSKDPNTIDVVIVDEKPSEIVKAMAIADPEFNPPEKFVKAMERGDAGEAYLMQPEDQYLYYAAKEIVAYQIELSQQPMMEGASLNSADPLSTIIDGEKATDPEKNSHLILRDLMESLYEPGFSPEKRILISKGREIAQELHSGDKIVDIDNKKYEPTTTLVVQCTEKEFNDKLESGYFDRYDKDMIICVEPYSEKIITHINRDNPNIIISTEPKQEHDYSNGKKEEIEKLRKEQPISSIVDGGSRAFFPEKALSPSQMIEKQEKKEHPEQLSKDTKAQIEKDTIRNIDAMRFEKGIREAVSIGAYGEPGIYIPKDDPHRPSICFIGENVTLSEEDKQRVFDKGITSMCYMEPLNGPLSIDRDMELTIEFADDKQRDRFIEHLTPESPIAIAKHKTPGEDSHIKYYVLNEQYKKIDELARDIGIFAIEHDMTIERALAEREHEQERTIQHDNTRDIPSPGNVEPETPRGEDERNIDAQLEYVETVEISPENVAEIEVEPNEPEHDTETPGQEPDIEDKESHESTPDDCPPL